MKLTLARGDDWSALYIDGFLHAQDHGTDWADAVDVILETVKNAYPEGVIFEQEEFQVDDQWLYDCGTMPEELELVKRAE